VSLRERREGHGCGLLLVVLFVIVLVHAVLALIASWWEVLKEWGEK
jgi:Tfp pilus assembly protein PilE